MMINLNLADIDLVQTKKSLYFAHYKTNVDIDRLMHNQNIPFVETFKDNIKKLSKNDWELHKRLIKEGINSDEISKIIRNDEIGNLLEISSQTNFNFNQTIEPSLYERCSFVNQYNVRLIDYAAFFGSIKCFKYLLMNGAYIILTGKYAVAGGNLEIIHLCEHNHSSFEGAYEVAIEFHRNDIFYYLYEIDIIKYINLEDLAKNCILYNNYEIFLFLEEKGLNVEDELIIEVIESGNLYLLKHLLEKNELPKEILVSAIKSRNIEIVQYVIDLNGFYNGDKYIFLLYLRFVLNN